MQKLVHHAGGLSLADVLPQARPTSRPDVRFDSCCGDSRQVQPGDVFVAILGDQEDGHDHYDEATRRGARAIVAERLLPTKLPTFLVKDSRVAYGQLCHALVDHPSQMMTSIGVTGTAGKTVTNELIRSVLESGGHCAGCINGIRSFDGMESSPSQSSTPLATEIARNLSQMAANGADAAVLEVSSKALAQRRTSGMQFDVVVLTNLRRDHEEFHGSVANYHKAKRRILQQLKPGGAVVLNADDPESQDWISRIDGPVLTVGTKQQADIEATVIERLPSEQTFLLTAGSDSFPVRTRIIGDHHVQNCLQAVAVGLLLGIDLSSIVRGIEAVESIPGRMERIECGQPFSVFVDYARTPDTLASCLHALKSVTTGRVICVTGAPGERLQHQRPLLGRVLEKASDLAVITSSDPAGEEPLEIAHDILDGFNSPGGAHIIPSRDKAIRWALEIAEEGDCVVIAGKGHETTHQLGRRQITFDDAELCRHMLYSEAEFDYPRPTIPMLLMKKK